MIPDGFPNSLGLMNIDGDALLGLVMQFSFFGILLFTAVSLLISFIHLVWYGTNPIRNYISIIIFLAVAVPIFLFAYKIMPEVIFNLNI